MTRCLSLLVVLVACSSAPPAAVPLEATPDSLASLAGRWQGHYTSAATGRQGSIVFALDADAQNARGDVVMYASNVELQPGRLEPRQPSRATVLSITFARAEGGEITGKLDPYRDPQTREMVSTTFTGRLKGDTIEGTFESHTSGSTAPQYGRWSVKRQQ